MPRIINKRSLKSAVVIIADGQNEQWYLAKVKEYYPNDTLRHTKLKPEMSQLKKSKDLFAAAKEKVEEGYTHVVIIIDLDTIRKDKQDLTSFKELYLRYLNVKAGIGRKSDKWMTHVLAIVNNPCLEYWYLVHFKQTDKFFPDYDSVKKALIKKPLMEQYCKSESYYYSSPDIFKRLGGLDGLSGARANSDMHIFNIAECHNKGVSEMRLLFDFFDKL